MKISRQADLGFRLLMVLGALPDAQHLSVRSIAESLNVSYDHLNKVSKALVKSGYLQSFRGAHGGVALAKPAKEINLLSIFSLLEPELVIIDCQAGKQGPCTFVPSCALKSILDEAMRSFLQTLGERTLADILGKES